MDKPEGLGICYKLLSPKVPPPVILNIEIRSIDAFIWFQFYVKNVRLKKYHNSQKLCQQVKIMTNQSQFEWHLIKDKKIKQQIFLQVRDFKSSLLTDLLLTF